MLKNVLLLMATANIAVMTLGIKAFFALSRNTKSPISSKRRDGENTTLICFVYQQCKTALPVYTKRRGFIVSFIHLLVGVWRCPYFDGLGDSNSLRLFCALMYGVLTKINKIAYKIKN